MRLKNFVAIALFLFVVIAGNIIIFGMISEALFFSIYFSYGLVSIFVFIFLIEDKFKDKGKLFFIVIFAIFLLFPISYYTSSVKEFYEHTKDIGVVKDELQQEINSATILNNYYVEYISYLEDQINEYKNNSQVLESRLAEINSEVKTITQEDTKTYYYREYDNEYEDDEREYGEEDDD